MNSIRLELQRYQANVSAEVAGLQQELQDLREVVGAGWAGEERRDSGEMRVLEEMRGLNSGMQRALEDIRAGAAQQREMLSLQRQRLDEATALALFEGLRSPAAAIAFLSWGWSLGGWWMALLTIIAFGCDPPTTMMIVGGSIVKSCFVRMGRCFLVRWCCGRRQAAPPGDVPLGPLEEVAPEVGAPPAPGWGFWLLGALIPSWMRAQESPVAAAAAAALLDPSPV